MSLGRWIRSKSAGTTDDDSGGGHAYRQFLKEVIHCSQVYYVGGGEP
ncbi:hypothetical protein ACFLXT_04725 [Chloroflexota bacterium]